MKKYVLVMFLMSSCVAAMDTDNQGNQQENTPSIDLDILALLVEAEQNELPPPKVGREPTEEERKTLVAPFHYPEEADLPAVFRIKPPNKSKS